MDPLAVHLAMTEAVAHMRTGGGPTLVEADTYRFFHQNGGFPGSAFGYRSKDEEAGWRARDPLTTVAHHLRRRRLLGDDELAATTATAKRVMAEIGDVILEPVPGGRPRERRIRDREWPDPAFADVGIRGDLSELDAAPLVDDVTGPHTEVAETKLVEAIAAVLARRMETDPRVVVLGEDVHRLNGGTNGATRGLSERFPDRILGTPISENAFTGLAGGLALDGRFRPVVELMYADFMWVAADQLFNQIGKVRHMFGGTSGVPLVLRSKVAMGTGYGSQHSMDPAGIFATAPGWRIVAPTTPYDYVGLMNTALRCEDPVVVLEHVDLYQAVGPGPIDDLDYCLPVGRAAVRRPGTGVTVLTYLGMVPRALEAADQVPEIDAEVIDLRWLDRASLDWDTIGESVVRTNQVLIAEQGPVGTSYGGWLADEVTRRFFDHLDAPVHRVTGGEASPSISRVLERAAIAQTDEVVSGAARDRAVLTMTAETRVPASPLARRLAREAGLRLTDLPGTGPGGRVRRRDVEAARARRAMASGRGGAHRRLETRGDVELRATVDAGPMVEVCAELAAGHGLVIDPVVLLVRAAGLACQREPALTGGRSDLVQRGDPADQPRVVPDVAGRRIDDLAAALSAAATPDAAEKAVLALVTLEGVEELTVRPEPGLPTLALGALHEAPVARDGAVVAAPVVRVTLAVDGRADPASAVRWLAEFVDLAAHPVRLLL